MLHIESTALRGYLTIDGVGRGEKYLTAFIKARVEKLGTVRTKTTDEESVTYYFYCANHILRSIYHQREVRMA